MVCPICIGTAIASGAPAVAAAVAAAAAARRVHHAKAPARPQQAAPTMRKGQKPEAAPPAGSGAEAGGEGGANEQ